MDLSKTIKRTLGVGLEQEAYRQFGAATEDLAQSVLGGILGSGANEDTNPETGSAELTDINRVGTWSPTYYAAAVARGGDLRPRTKFLFKVSFAFNQQARSLLAQVMGVDPDTIQRQLTFSVRTIDKPQFEFEYEEVNLYNFRTKVLRRITHRDVNISFYDDTGNTVLRFLEMYRRAFMPIARLNQAGISDSLDQFGFAFSQTPTSRDTSLRGVLPGRAMTPLAQIIIHQIYVDGGSTGPTNPQHAVKSNNFIFTNPRLTAINYDELDVEQGGSPGITTVSFDFDTLYVSPGDRLLGGGDVGLEPQHPAGDILFGARTGGSGEISANGSPNPFVDVIARQGARAVQETVSGALNKAFGGTIAGRALGGTFYKIGSIVGSAGGRTLGSVALGVSSSITPAAQPPVIDNSAGGEVTGRVPAALAGE